METLNITNILQYGGLFFCALIGLPFITMAVDYFTQFICNINVKINTQIIDKFPILKIRKKLQDRQVYMLKRSILSFQVAIKKISTK